jgi:hypothetical protein
MDIKVIFKRVDVDTFSLSTMPLDLIPVKGDFICIDAFHYEVTGRKYFFVVTDDDGYILDKNDVQMIIYIEPTEFKDFSKSIGLERNFFKKLKNDG